MFKNLTYEKKSFYIFLLVHLILWSSIGLIRKVLPTDTLEGIFWGSLQSFGNPKHPPLAGLYSFALYLPFKCDFIMYFFSQLLIFGGFIYTYKLAKNFLSANQALLSVILLEGCWIYGYITGYYGINPDTLLLFLLPAIAYYFYKSMFEGKFSDWLLLGFFTGLGLLDKYQSGLLLTGAFIWALIFNRRIFKNIFFYISALTAFIIFLPHFIWLINNDFLPFLYFKGKLENIDIASHIISPLSFLFMQLLQILPAIAVFVLCRIVYKKGFTLNKNAGKQGWFLLILTGAPLIVHTFTAAWTGSGVRPQWNYVFWFMTGIMLFYFFPFETDKKSFNFTLKSAYALMFISCAVFGVMLSVEKNYRSRYPVSDISQELQNIWQEKYGSGTFFKYIGGDHELAYPLAIYSAYHPFYLMETFGHKNIWLDEEDLKESGAMTIARSSVDLITYAPFSVPYIKEEDVLPQEYKFKVYNAFNQEREYTIYYFIVPPQPKNEDRAPAAS